MKQKISFTLNQKSVTVSVNGSESLLTVLREYLDMTGTKFGCGLGECGACTVLIDKKAVRSCMIAVEDVAGKDILSIEGLSSNGSLHPIQKAFVTHDSMQCGFCTPGMIMNAYGLLLRNSKTSRTEIINGMEENLCRCGSYNRIVDAIETAAEEMSKKIEVMKSTITNEAIPNEMATALLNSRRDFLKKLGGGVIVAFTVGKLSILDGWANNPEVAMLNFNAYLRVKEDGRVDCYTGKIEMGQGVGTSLAQAVAEELEVSIYTIDMVMGDTELCPYDDGTWGSMTTRFADPVLRAAAAEARIILIGLAAEQLKVAPALLEVKEGVVYVKNDPSRKISYAALTKGQKIIQTLKDKPVLKKAKDFKVVGTSIVRLDAEAKVTGKAKYTGDIKLPGMVYASIVRPSVFGSKKRSVDASKLADFEGAQLIEDGNLVAVVHSNSEIAYAAAQKIQVSWEAPELKVDQETIFKHLENTIKDSRIHQEGGNLATGQTLSETIIEGDYLDGYKAHASVETHCATCFFEGDKLTMWASTQSPFGTRKRIAKTLNMPLEKVHLKQILLGGGFGGKISDHQAVEAAKIAKICGKPVQLIWSRKEEFMFVGFRPAALMKVRSGVDGNGKLKLWNFDIYCAGTRGTELFYEVEHNRTRMFDDESVHPFEVGAWRAPGNNSTTFARESHIDVTACKLGIDPLQFRLNNLKDEKMRATLQLAAQTFGWEKPKKEGHGYGIALGEDAGTCVALIAEVYVDKSTGIVQPIRIVCAQDMGQVVNPHGATIQTEGGITMGLGYALYEDIAFEGGNLKTTGFGNYEITRFSKTPTITCVFIDKMDAKPEGGGEPAIICVGGAIANAVFDACGARVNQMPISAERILGALS